MTTTMINLARADASQVQVEPTQLRGGVTQWGWAGPSYWGERVFNIKTPSGLYDVTTLHYETMPNRTVGERSFDVVIQDRRVASSLDLMEEAGYGRLYGVEAKKIQVDDNVIQIAVRANPGKKPPTIWAVRLEQVGKVEDEQVDPDDEPVEDTDDEPTELNGNVVSVDNPNGLRRALSGARNGTVVEVQNGSYSMGKIRINAHGVTLRAANPGNATILGTEIGLYGDKNVIEGFILDGSPVDIGRDCNDNEVKHNLFRGGAGDHRTPAVTVKEAIGTRIHHNELRSWDGRGFVIDPRGRKGDGGKGITSCQRTHIYSNHLHRLPSQGWRDQNSADAIQIGRYFGQTFVEVGAVVEYNLIDNVERDREAISVKCSGNTIQHNTVINSHAALQVRHGTKNKLIGNWVENCMGLVVYGDDHEVMGNTVVKCPIVIRNGNCDMDDFVQNNIRGGDWHPACRRVKCYDNKGELGIGDRVPRGNGAGGVDARDTSILGHVGNVTRVHERGTAQSSSAIDDIQPAKRLTPADVGPAWRK